MAVEDYQYVKNIAQDFNFRVTPLRMYKIAERVDANTPVEVIVAYLTAAYDSTGPQGLTVPVRFSDYELEQIDKLIDYHSTIFNKIKLRDVLIYGLRSALTNKHTLVPAEERRTTKKTIRLNTQLEKLIKYTIAMYSDELYEISTNQAILYGLYGAIRDMELNIKYNT